MVCTDTSILSIQVLLPAITKWPAQMRKLPITAVEDSILRKLFRNRSNNAEQVALLIQAPQNK